MKNIVIFFILTLFSTSVFAQWQIESFSQNTNQDEIKSATTKNAEGFELAIFKTSEGIVWLNFSLSDNNLDELAQNELPIFQIDDHKPVKLIRGFTATIVPADQGIAATVVNDNQSISTERNFDFDHIIAERLPERVICPIWQGESRPHLDTVNALINGQSIGFKYTLLNGSKGQTSFDLEGAKDAINAVLHK